jgi:hypothetical protein
MGGNQAISIVHIATPEHGNKKVEINRTLSVLDIISVFKDTLNVKENEIIKLHTAAGVLIPIGPNIPENDDNTCYNVSIATFVELPKSDIENSFKAISTKLDVMMILMTRA